MSRFDPALVDRFLAHHWRFNPVDATFMGERGYDHRLPPAGAETLDDERAGIAELLGMLEASEEPDDLGQRLDRRMMIAELTVRQAAAESRPRLANPAWYSGEAAFGIISLLLPQSAPVREAALLDRLEGVDGFLAQGAERLAGVAVPAGWVARARRECAAMALFLREDIALHEDWAEGWQAPATRAADAFERFASALDGLDDADPAAGEAYLTLLMRTQHGLDFGPREALERAEAAFARLGEEMEAMADAIRPGASAAIILAKLAAIGPESVDAAFKSYEAIDQKARKAAEGLMTLAQGYGLDYRWMAPCFRRVSQTLYFLFYRSPPGLDAGSGSVYWVTPPGSDETAFLAANPTAIVKTIHSVHHGGVGHHTQNARARVAASRLARIAGTDCALGLAFLGSGTLIEGWACYVEDLLMEADGFYSPAEMLLLKQFERRNAASVLVDIRLHLGEWSEEEAIAFYRDEAGFAPSRVAGEVVRNTMLPASRLMYWLGVEGIKALRNRWRGDTVSFHDTLLSFGHMPLAWIAEEMDRAGQLG
ncbi:DUF885 family protein [Arsenicitalea aurantiaca]|uniref:DUF885 family protein n=1 Tax=Arsenicitalea aurantiaca TaxID=1783274 RepID=A0A433XAG7_9HYPH|nr:DUF885 family protein [Arsenicitalea aurantiaca]RUT31076.1 DUF885 family protein [Arsenicitalea aurantiaca]